MLNNPRGFFPCSQPSIPPPPPWNQHPAGFTQRGPCPRGPAVPHCTDNRMMNRSQNEDIFGYNLNQRPSCMGQFRPPFPTFLPRNRGPYNHGPRHNNPKCQGQQQRGNHGNQGHDNSRNGQNNYQRNGNMHQKKKKNKRVDKRDLAENNKFYCDACDRGYKDEDKYQDHVNQHVKCKYESCAYVAHPKLVQLHINLQHRSGLAKKIWQLESREDVEKWRNERKRNFPTVANIARKAEERANRIARGEVIETKSFGKMNNSGGNGMKENCTGQRKRDWKERKRQKWLARNGQTLETRSSESMDRGDEASPEKRRKLESAPEQRETKESPVGTLCVDPLSMLETREMLAKTDKSPDTMIIGALGSLMSSYADSEEEEEEVEVVRKEEEGVRGGGGTGPQEEKKEGGGTEPHNGDTEEVNNNANKPTTGETDILGDVKGPTPRRKRQRKRKRRNNQQRQNNNGNLKLKKSTLLEKLLAPAIRHERNVIMQCVHYIVKNNFFDKDSHGHSIADSIK